MVTAPAGPKLNELSVNGFSDAETAGITPVATGG